ncbi:MAG: PorT family protein [Bacteroidetes bacterium]|nr:PorT family protein [Bacteroidota bacterium]MCY4233291.1 PorT family protein [Bacteroidota bacterium]
MNRHYVIILVCFFLVSGVSAQNFGVSVGANFQRLNDIALNELETKFESQNGWHVGAWIELPLGPAALRGGARYMAAGKLFEGIQESHSSVRDNFDVSLVEIYLILRLGFPSPVVSPYVFAGPVFRLPAQNDADISNDLKILSYAGEIGGGLEIGLGPVTLHPELAYVFGITRFIENELILQQIKLQAGDPQRLNVAMLRLSVGL